MNKLKAVIFDMDGTLLDSEPIWLRADLAMIAAHGGFMTEEEHDACVGMGAPTFLPMIKKKYGIKASYEELRDFQERTYLEIARSEITAFPEMVDFARWAAGSGLRIAIASGSTNTIIDEMTTVTGIRELFPVRVSSHEVDRGKPEPFVFLETARRLAVKPEECLVIEDSPVGVEAACRAGMHSMAVPQPVAGPPSDSLKKADYVFNGGMTTFTCSKAVEWVRSRFAL